MDKKILPHLTTAQLILILVVLNTLLIGYIASTINYNRQLTLSNQESILRLTNETAQLVEHNGNVSVAQRHLLIGEVQHLSQHGGMATNDNITKLSQEIANLTHTVDNLKLGRSQ